MSKVEDLLVGRPLKWITTTYDENDSTYSTLIAHSYSGTIVRVLDDCDYAIIKAEDETVTCLSLYEVMQWLEKEPDFMAIRNAVSRRHGELKKAAQLAECTPHDIYALVDPRDNSIRYVGMSMSVETRYFQHLHCSGTNARKNAWIQNLKDNNLQPVLIILEHVIGRYYTHRREEYWINYYLEQGLPLTNMDTPGIDVWSKVGVEA